MIIFFFLLSKLFLTVTENLKSSKRSWRDYSLNYFIDVKKLNDVKCINVIFSYDFMKQNNTNFFFQIQFLESTLKIFLFQNVLI